MKKVFICSPFRSSDPVKYVQYKEWAVALCHKAIHDNCIPYAPHVYFPRFLKDEDEEERRLGTQIGLYWLSLCDELWELEYSGTEIIPQQIEKGPSLGMKDEIVQAKILGIPIIKISLEDVKQWLN